ncbi:MAG TPA: MauE/DoxX family redox-associated membrane protein [Ktedonobacteraceae bacterium]|nr:MauE/DoxX family redox-associated membrane protein [Ktedonobacteraceae bacterium]
MNIVHYILDIYFSAVLGIAGISKIDGPQAFIISLRRHYLLPEKSVSFIGICFPWIEICLSVLLLAATGTIKLIVTICVLICFVLFSYFNVATRFKHRSTSDCGCFGKALQRRGMNTNGITSLIQLVLAFLLTITALQSDTLSWIYYLTSSVLFVGTYVWLLWRTWCRYRRLNAVRSQALSPLAAKEG